MKIEHAAIWAHDIEKLREFYEKNFSAVSGDKYVNSAKGFQSYFLTFESGARLELMQLSSVQPTNDSKESAMFGFAHLAFAVGTKEKVDSLTSKLGGEGFPILDGPRTTGDGYYESVVLDPEGNRLEITV